MFKNRFLQCVSTIYGFFISVGSNLQSLFLLWMRLTWGHQFFLKGLEKLQNIDKVTTYFTSLGIHSPHFSAYLVGYVEMLGGLLLCFGLASRLAGAILAFTMMMALSAAHASALAHFRFIYEPSSLVGEAPYPFLITSLLIFIFGPGRLSLDGWIKRWADKQPKY